jgi:hypothetical protein
MSMPGFAAERSIGKAQGSYRSGVSSNMSAGTAQPAFSWCGVNCSIACRGNPLCFNWCISAQQHCPSDLCRAQCANLTGKAYFLCYLHCIQDRCYNDCITSTGTYAPPHNVCNGTNDPFCDYLCTCLCYRQC